METRRMEAAYVSVQNILTQCADLPKIPFDVFKWWCFTKLKNSEQYILSSPPAAFLVQTLHALHSAPSCSFVTIFTHFFFYTRFDFISNVLLWGLTSLVFSTSACKTCLATSISWVFSRSASFSHSSWEFFFRTTSSSLYSRRDTLFATCLETQITEAEMMDGLWDIRPLGTDRKLQSSYIRTRHPHAEKTITSACFVSAFGWFYSVVTFIVFVSVHGLFVSPRSCFDSFWFVLCLFVNFAVLSDLFAIRTIRLCRFFVSMWPVADSHLFVVFDANIVQHFCDLFAIIFWVFYCVFVAILPCCTSCDGFFLPGTASFWAHFGPLCCHYGSLCARFAIQHFFVAVLHLLGVIWGHVVLLCGCLFDCFMSCLASLVSI